MFGKILHETGGAVDQIAVKMLVLGHNRAHLARFRPAADLRASAVLEVAIVLISVAFSMARHRHKTLGEAVTSVCTRQPRRFCCSPAPLASQMHTISLMMRLLCAATPPVHDYRRAVGNFISRC